MGSLLLDTTFDETSYNNLASVDEADEIVRNNQAGDSLRDRFLKEAAKVVCSHNMQDRFGVALLHKHYPCSPGERIVEEREMVLGHDALVTRPHPGAAREDVSPVIWKIVGDEFRPLAFSVDTLARQLLVEEEVPEAFLADFADVTKRLQAEELFGLSVVDRDLFNRAQGNETPLELSSEIERRSVLSMLEREKMGGRTIQTTWTFTITDETECVATCRQECWNIIGPPHHEVKHFDHHIGRQG
jgi:hypothetical protein